MARSWITEVARAMREPLAAYGFTGRGRMLHRLSGNGDIVAVELRKGVVLDDGGERFYVLFGLVPGPWWDYLRGGVEGTTLDELGRPRPEAGIWSDSVPPPRDSPSGAPPGDGWPERQWVARDAGSAALAARLLVDELERTVLPDLIRYSADRRAVLDELARPLHDILEIAFAADAGDRDELERLLLRHEPARTGDRPARRRAPGLAGWARDYAARKASAVGQRAFLPAATDEVAGEDVGPGWPNRW